MVFKQKTSLKSSSIAEEWQDLPPDQKTIKPNHLYHTVNS